MANAAQRFDTSGLRLLIRCKQDDLFPVWMAVLFPCIQTNLAHSHHITCHVPAMHITSGRSATIHFGELQRNIYPVVDRVDRSSRSNLGQVESIEKSSTRSTFKSSRSSFTASRVDRFHIDLIRLYIDLTETYKIFGSFRSTDLVT